MNFIDYRYSYDAYERLELAKQQYKDLLKKDVEFTNLKIAQTKIRWIEGDIIRGKSDCGINHFYVYKNRRTYIVKYSNNGLISLVSVDSKRSKEVSILIETYKILANLFLVTNKNKRSVFDNLKLFFDRHKAVREVCPNKNELEES